MMLLGGLFGGAAMGGAAAATGAAAAGISASTALTALAGIGTAFSALATIRTSRMEASALEAQAGQEALRERDEFIAGREQEAALRRELAATVGRQAVAFAAGGVDLSSQSFQRARADAVDEAEREIGFTRTDALRRAADRRQQARVLRARASATRSAGPLTAAGQIGNFALSVARRG